MGIMAFIFWGICMHLIVNETERQMKLDIIRKNNKEMELF